MKRAWVFIRKGFSKSLALKKAWAIEKEVATEEGKSFSPIVSPKEFKRIFGCAPGSKAFVKISSDLRALYEKLPCDCTMTEYKEMHGDLFWRTFHIIKGHMGWSATTNSRLQAQWTTW